MLTSSFWVALNNSRGAKSKTKPLLLSPNRSHSPSRVPIASVLKSTHTLGSSAAQWSQVTFRWAHLYWRYYLRMLLDYKLIKPLQTDWEMLKDKEETQFSLSAAGQVGVMLLLTVLAACPTTQKHPICGLRRTMASEGEEWLVLWTYEERKPILVSHTDVTPCWEGCCETYCETPLSRKHLPDKCGSKK